MDLNKFPELKSTYSMLKCAFPNDISSEEYFALLDILYNHLSDRNLARVIACLTGKDYYVIINDVYKVGATFKTINIIIKNDCMHKLRKCNFDQWQKEE